MDVRLATVTWLVKAIVRSEYGTPDILRLEEIPTPEPGDGEVLVRIRASSVNRTDLESLAGRPLVYRAFMGLRRPRNGRLGLDAAGEVEAVGPGVERFKPGDKVFADLLYHGMCAFAEYACAREKAWRPIPDGVDFETAATLPASAVLALQGLGGRDGVRAGERVLIIGASGSVGIFAVQLAKAAGAHVTGVSSAGKFDLVRSIGADDVIDYARENYTRGDRRYDRILDAVAMHSVFSVRRALTAGGVYGAHGGRSSGGLLQAMALGPLLSVGRKRRIGVVMGRPNDAADLATVGEMVRAGTLVPLIDRTFTLAGVPEALRIYAAGEARGKLVIRI
ncbi:MAG: NAD(P)-dependent alcohol dehydrogenase [Candidatus Limnocylindria bacterium]